jgi:hypothetical protein
MKVYILCFHDYEGGFFDSVYSTKEKTEQAKVKHNKVRENFDEQASYDWEEVEVDDMEA